MLSMTIDGTAVALVWAEPIERGDLELVAGDVSEAFNWFKDKTGQEQRVDT